MKTIAYYVDIDGHIAPATTSGTKP